MDRISAMTVFRRVVELNGFAAAARDLRMSNAAASKQVAWLEERLKVRLLNRTTRRMSLTEAGQLYYEHAARILDEMAEAERAVSEHAGRPQGLLRVNAPMSFGIRHLGPALPEFLSRYPEITVDLALDDRVIDLLEEGWDMAVRIADLPDSSLTARRIGPIRRVLAASPAYLASRGEPATPADLAGHECLIYSYLPHRDDSWRLHGPEGPVTVRVSGRLRANNGDVLAQAAAGGAGIALLPTFIIDDHLGAGRLRVVLPDYGSPGPAIHAVYPPGRSLTPKVRALTDFLVERFGRERRVNTDAPAAGEPRPGD